MIDSEMASALLDKVYSMMNDSIKPSDIDKWKEESLDRLSRLSDDEVSKWFELTEYIVGGV